MMVEYKDQLQRVSHLRCFGMYQCVGKSKVRVRSFGEGKDLYLTRAEIFEFADNIKDWCKDMVDPPEEKEECPPEVNVFIKEIARVDDMAKRNLDVATDQVDKLYRLEKRQDVQTNRLDAHDIWKVDIEKEYTELRQRIEALEKEAKGTF